MLFRFSLYVPVLTKDGYRIFIDKVTHNEDLFNVGMIMKYFSMQTDLRYLEDGLDNGDLILFDCNHINFLKFITFLPYFIKSLSLILEVNSVENINHVNVGLEVEEQEIDQTDWPLHHKIFAQRKNSWVGPPVSPTKSTSDHNIREPARHYITR